MEELRRKQKTIVIGIIGIHNGAGVTTMAVAMANYMSAFLKKKTAVVECNDTKDFLKMRDALGIKDNGYHEQDGYSFKKNDFYPKGTSDIMSLSGNGYDVIIVDFGKEISGINEFARCHHKIVMGSLEPWHQESYDTFCGKMQEYGGSDTWLHILHGDSGSVNISGKRSGIYTMKRPVIDNPFIIGSGLIEFFQTLF